MLSRDFVTFYLWLPGNKTRLNTFLIVLAAVKLSEVGDRRAEMLVVRPKLWPLIKPFLLLL